jgi:hypothetical protein
MISGIWIRINVVRIRIVVPIVRYRIHMMNLLSKALAIISSLDVYLPQGRGKIKAAHSEMYGIRCFARVGAVYVGGGGPYTPRLAIHFKLHFFLYIERIYTFSVLRYEAVPRVDPLVDPAGGPGANREERHQGALRHREGPAQVRPYMGWGLPYIFLVRVLRIYLFFFFCFPAELTIQNSKHC